MSEKGKDARQGRGINGIDDKPPEVRIRYRLKNRTVTAAQVLSRVLRYSGLQDKLAKYQFVEYWDKIVGKTIALKAKPDSIRNGVLYVNVENSSWAQELSFQKNVIRSRLNSFLGQENSVKDVVFSVKSFINKK